MRLSASRGRDGRQAVAIAQPSQGVSLCFQLQLARKLLTGNQDKAECDPAADYRAGQQPDAEQVQQIRRAVFLVFAKCLFRSDQVEQAVVDDQHGAVGNNSGRLPQVSSIDEQDQQYKPAQRVGPGEPASPSDSPMTPPRNNDGNDLEHEEKEVCLG